MADEEKQDNINQQIAKLQQQRIAEARAKIQAILDEYDLQLQGIITIPTTEIRIVPRGR